MLTTGGRFAAAKLGQTRESGFARFPSTLVSPRERMTGLELKLGSKRCLLARQGSSPELGWIREMEPITDIGTVEIQRSQQVLWKSGTLAAQWSRRFPELFDEDDRRLAEIQGPLGFHLYEWLAAIVLHHATGYLSLVSKYEFAKHRRKQEIVEKLLPADTLRMLRNRTGHGRAQPPDLLMYAPDLLDWFFCEVKGPGDRLKPQQVKKFEALATMTARPVRLLRLKWAWSGSEGASSSP